MAIGFKLSQFDNTDPAEPGQGISETLFQERLQKVLALQSDVVSFAKSQSYSNAQVRDALNGLFTSFSLAWFEYLIIGSDNITTAITNDVTLAWLDIDAGGQTIRTRLVNRLS